LKRFIYLVLNVTAEIYTRIIMGDI